MELVPAPRHDALFAEDWVFVLFVGCLAMVAYGRYFEPRQIRRIWSNIFNIRLMRQEMREETQHRRASVMYFLLFTISLSLLIQFSGFELLQSKLPGWNDYLVFLLLVGVVGVTYLVKGATTLLISHLAGGDFSLSEYRYSFYLINQLAGLVLFPVVVMAAYTAGAASDFILAGGAALFAVLVLYRWARGILNALNKGVPLFYIFFYICTLEILPIALIASLVQRL